MLECGVRAGVGIRNPMLCREGKPVTAYGINKFCHRLTVDHGHRALAKTDLNAALSHFDISEEEQQAILKGDVGYLFDRGVHPLLLVRLFVYSIAGLTEAVYAARMRSWASARGIPLP